MLEEKQQMELNQRRHDLEACKAKIINEENDLDNEVYAIKCLDRWKKGRSVGFFICMIVSIACFTIEFFYVYIQGNSAITMMNNVAGAIEFAVSSTAISFFTILFLAVSISTIILGLRLMLEVGNSSFSRRMATKYYIKNYYNHIENHINNKIKIEKEIIELKQEKRQITKEIERLEKDETPWDFT